MPPGFVLLAVSAVMLMMVSGDGFGVAEDVLIVFGVLVIIRRLPACLVCPADVRHAPSGLRPGAPCTDVQRTPSAGHSVC